MVNTSPATAVVIPVPPAIWKASPRFTAVPLESSPTIVIGSGVIVNVSLDIDVFNPVPLAPTIVKVSVALLAVVDPTLPVTVVNWSGALALAVIV